MIEQTPKRIQSLDAIRAIAALAVIVFHAGTIAAAQGYIEEPTTYSYWGKYGVHIFFCLSGFIICFVHYHDIGKPERCPNYLWRRWARIWPLYAVFTLGQVVLSAITNYGEQVDLARVITSLLFLDVETTPIVNVGWTLVHEAFFYLTFAFFILIGRRIAAWGFIVFMLVQAWIEFFPANEDSLTPWVFHQLRWLFISGIGGALAVKDIEEKRKLSILPCFQFGFMTALLVLTLFLGAEFRLTSGRLLTALMIQLVLVLIVVLETRDKLNVPASLNYLGKASYSIYLAHSTFMYTTLKISSGIFGDFISSHIFLTMTLLGIGAIVVGIIVHELIEKNITKLVQAIKTVYIGSFIR